MVRLTACQLASLRTGKCGYTVALLASKAAFHQGNHVHLSVTACEIDTRTTAHDSPVVLYQRSI
jgi:hypothetical protein